jgi:hypothetical protein
MRSGPTAAAVALLSLALALPGCGEEGAATAGGEKEARGAGASPSAAAQDAPPPGLERAAAPARPAAAKRCARTLGDFLDAIESIANTLAVGVDHESYLTTLDRVRATYAEVPTDRLGLVCLGRVAAPAERALNVYIESANEWGGCLAEPSCDSRALEPRLQRRWAKAANLIGEARSGLRDLA